MADNDLVNILFVEIGIPDTLGINDQRRTQFTAIKAACHIHPYGTLTREIEFLDATLGVVSQRFGTFSRTTSALAWGTPVGAEEQMVSVVTHGGRYYRQVTAPTSSLPLHSASGTSRAAQVSALADLCVKCGLCLPHCPTYRLTQDEAESPRGRIALMQGLATGVLEPTPALQDHIEGCLTCRSCETVCPAKVPYGELLDQGRGLLHEQGKSWPSRWWLQWLIKHGPRQWIQRSLRWLQQLGVLRALSLLLPGQTQARRLLRYLPPLAAPTSWNSHYPAQGDKRGSVSLFTGCIGEMMQPQVLRDSITVLNALGFDVEVPPDQACCGALNLHAGRTEAAARLAQRNQAAFTGRTLVGCDSGCLTTLREYGQFASNRAGKMLSVHDICAFVDRHWHDGMTVAPLSARVALHIPCTQRNGLKDPMSSQRLLRRIPGLDLILLNPAGGCCGAAGDYFLSHPDTSDQLVQPLCQQINAANVDAVLSSNVGCALHVRAHCEGGGKADVMHPISLLVRQLRGAA